MRLGTILLAILVLMLFGTIPAWPYSYDWGYAPSGLVAFLLIALLESYYCWASSTRLNSRPR